MLHWIAVRNSVHRWSSSIERQNYCGLTYSVYSIDHVSSVDHEVLGSCVNWSRRLLSCFFGTCADAVHPWSHVVHHRTSRFWVNVVLNRDVGAQHVDSLFCCSCEYFKQMKSTWPIYFPFCHIQSWHISNDLVRWAVLRWKAASCYGSLSLQEVLDFGVRLLISCSV